MERSEEPVRSCEGDVLEVGVLYCEGDGEWGFTYWPVPADHWTQWTGPPCPVSLAV